MAEDFKHFTVMKNEAVDALDCKDGLIYVDCTLGGGGHSDLILNRIQPNGRLIAFDVDDDAIKAASERLKDYKNLTIVKKEMSKEEAKKFYSVEKNEKGKLQIEYGKKDTVSLYFCEDYYNYFYGVLPISTGFAKIYEIMKYHGGILIRYPSKKDSTKLPVFEENKKLLETLDEYEL